MRRPRSVTGLGFVLIVIGVLMLLNLARGAISYFAVVDGGGAPQVSVGEFLLVHPEQTLVPAGIGILSGIAAVGVFRGSRWGQILAIAVGAASVLGGVALSLYVIVESGMPGSFAVLFLPVAVVALLIGAYVLHAALVNRAYFSQ